MRSIGIFQKSHLLSLYNKYLVNYPPGAKKQGATFKFIWKSKIEFAD